MDSKQLLQQNAALPPRRKRLQRFYLFLGISVFASVVYFSYANHQGHDETDTASSPYDFSQHKNGYHSKRLNQPNIVFILTDDQDIVLAGADHMPKTYEMVAQQGAVMENSFVASPLCCPSRSTILSGRFVHNHRAYNNSFIGGCSGTHWQNVVEKEALPVHLQSAGYKTFFAGKYLNQYGKRQSGGTSHVPPGWDTWNGLVGNSKYYNYTLSVDGISEVHGNDPDKDYLTKIIWERAKEFLETVTGGVTQKNENNFVESPHKNENVVPPPFFIMMSTPSAHAPFDAEPQYMDNFADLKAKRTASFNIANDETKHWLLRLGEQPLSDDIIDKVDDIFRKRLRTLLTVDDMVGDIVSILEAKNLMDNTYVVFASDNGYHLGQFSMPLDKREPYEFDIRVPLMIRGPGIKKGVTLSYPTVNVDLLPTFLDWAGIAIPEYIDGISLKDILMETSNVENNFDTTELNVKENDENNNDSEDEKESLESRNDLIDISLRDGEQASDSGKTYTRTSRGSVQYLKRAILIEHSGEGLWGQQGACSYLGPGVFSCLEEFACKCQDSKNNTYSCVRQMELPILYKFHENEMQQDKTDVKGTTIEDAEAPGLHRVSRNNNVVGPQSKHRMQALVKDTVFCVWDDDENFIEFYDLTTDFEQLNNAVDSLTADEIKQYTELLETLISCEGSSCFVEGF